MHLLEKENHAECGLLTAATMKINLAKPLLFQDMHFYNCASFT